MTNEPMHTSSCGPVHVHEPSTRDGRWWVEIHRQDGTVARVVKQTYREAMVVYREAVALSRECGGEE